MTCFPCTVNLKFLVELIMDHSKLENLWEGKKVSHVYLFLLSFVLCSSVYKITMFLLFDCTAASKSEVDGFELFCKLEGAPRSLNCH